MKPTHPLLAALMLGQLAAPHAAGATVQTPVIPALQPIDLTMLPQGIKRLDLFLLMGQSNMQGTGRLPAKQACAEVLMERELDVMVGLIRCA
jgi:hypothetical protein